MSNAQFGKKFTFFRPQFAINFQAVTSQKGLNTINIEIAPVDNKEARWRDKISLQLSDVDLFKYFYTFSHGIYYTYESKYHGKDRNKSIRFNEHNKGCNISLSDAGRVLHFNCSVGEWFYAQLLLLEQMLGHPLSVTEARELILLEKRKSKDARSKSS
ncbi:MULTISPECIES: hypothetical protein [Pseudoalteromonas]|uniref:hypothetical protein n=1 Tax=Pseudoalteromonas TaxID=53246 RepID=UPI00158258C0|nr:MULTISPECIES: hypothetical protein [Pseudoalteromonas]MDI4652624.1 hypothetical protein [Pseudoalteromonas shioyasakiensis]NUJ38666.1 hypothetical protein [Pseudoalteromonas sp. 0303]